MFKVFQFNVITTLNFEQNNFEPLLLITLFGKQHHS